MKTPATHTHAKSPHFDNNDDFVIFRRIENDQCTQTRPHLNMYFFFILFLHLYSDVERINDCLCMCAWVSVCVYIQRVRHPKHSFFTVCILKREPNPGTGCRCRVFLSFLFFFFFSQNYTGVRLPRIKEAPSGFRGQNGFRTCKWIIV